MLWDIGAVARAAAELAACDDGPAVQKHRLFERLGHEPQTNGETRAALAQCYVSVAYTYKHRCSNVVLHTGDRDVERKQH